MPLMMHENYLRVRPELSRGPVVRAARKAVRVAICVASALMLCVCHCLHQMQYPPYHSWASRPATTTARGSSWWRAPLTRCPSTIAPHR
jgi:hypothetical protein